MHFPTIFRYIYIYIFNILITKFLFQLFFLSIKTSAMPTNLYYKRKWNKDSNTFDNNWMFHSSCSNIGIWFFFSLLLSNLLIFVVFHRFSVPYIGSYHLILSHVILMQKYRASDGFCNKNCKTFLCFVVVSDINKNKKKAAAF